VRFYLSSDCTVCVLSALARKCCTEHHRTTACRSQALQFTELAQISVARVGLHPYCCRFWVLETVARVPYFAFISVLHLYETLGAYSS
jgi:hypothetical protein